MKEFSHLMTALLTAMLILVGIVSVLSPYSQVMGDIRIATITTPSVTTSTTYSATLTSVVSTTSSTVSTSFSTTTSSTSTTTTSTATSFSYTSTYSTTTTNTTTYTSFTGTASSASTSTTTVAGTSTQTSTSTSTQAATTTVAVFPGCLIATATFGSELAPEVQLLRSFRDNAILKTTAGSGFMVAFNAWYYSFSPAVAGYLYTHPTEQTMMRFVLYPLVGILKISSFTFAATSAVPELAALLSGLVASSLIGAFYLGLPLSLIRAKVRRLRGGAGLEKGLAVGLSASVAALLAGEILGATLLMTWSSVAVVLSALFLSALVTSSKLSRKLLKL